MEEKSSKQEKPYESIFDAFRVIAPSSPLLQLETETPQFFMRTCKYDVINMGGYYSAFPGFPTRLFRGEYKNYPTCKASIYRSNDPDDFIVDELRCLEFKNILMTFPQVQYAIQDRIRWNAAWGRAPDAAAGLPDRISAPKSNCCAAAPRS